MMEHSLNHCLISRDHYTPTRRDGHRRRAGNLRGQEDRRDAVYRQYHVAGRDQDQREKHRGRLQDAVLADEEGFAVEGRRAAQMPAQPA